MLEEEAFDTLTAVGVDCILDLSICVSRWLQGQSGVSDCVYGGRVSGLLCGSTFGLANCQPPLLIFYYSYLWFWWTDFDSLRFVWHRITLLGDNNAAAAFHGYSTGCYALIHGKETTVDSGGEEKGQSGDVVETDQQGPHDDLHHADLEEKEVGRDATQPDDQVGATDLEDEATLQEVVPQSPCPEGQRRASNEEQHAVDNEGDVRSIGSLAGTLYVLLPGRVLFQPVPLGEHNVLYGGHHNLQHVDNGCFD